MPSYQLESSSKPPLFTFFPKQNYSELIIKSDWISQVMSCVYLFECLQPFYLLLAKWLGQSGQNITLSAMCQLVSYTLANYCNYYLKIRF